MALSRIKTWTTEVLTASDLNAEFDNILDNATSLITPLTGTVNANSNILSNAIFTHTVVTFADGDATPSVAAGTVFKTANTTPTTITALDGGTNGQFIYLVINDANTTIDFTGTTLLGNVGVDWTPTTGDSMICFFVSPNWYCHISDNTA